MNRTGSIHHIGTAVVFIVFLFCLFVYQNSRCAYDGPITQIKNGCFGGARVLIGAVEMYDMDHRSSPMKTLDLPLLVKEGYLKTELHGADPDCRFKADLLASNQVAWCEKHGNSASPTALFKEVEAHESSLLNRIRIRIRIAFSPFLR